MERFKSTNTLSIIEIDGSEVELYNPPKMNVISHEYKKCFVVLEIEGKEYTLLADALVRAIKNAQNAHDF